MPGPTASRRGGARSNGERYVRDHPSPSARGGTDTASVGGEYPICERSSFEVPGAPTIYTTLRAQPQVAINLDVQARRIVEGGRQLRGHLDDPRRGDGSDAQGNGQAPATVVFIAELTYAGVFTLTGLPDNAVEPVLLVECPRILFPFARNILADVTRDGGFPPVLLQPIDFVPALAEPAGAASTGSSA